MLFIDNIYFINYFIRYFITIYSSYVLLYITSMFCILVYVVYMALGNQPRADPKS